METPVSAFMKLRKAFPGKPAFLFESVERGEQVGRYSILGFYSDEVLNWTLTPNENPLDLLKERLAAIGGVLPKSPFPIGSFGYLGYDAVRAFEKLPAHKKTSPFPDAYFIFPKRMILFDHVQNTLDLIVIEDENDCEKSLADFQKALSAEPDHAYAVKTQSGQPSKTASSETRESYLEKVEKAKEYIRAGDIYQAVLSQQLQTQTSAAPIDIYRALRMLNPSPYMYYLDFNDFQVIGSSPEMLVKVAGKTAETRPIAGTRPRGKTVEEDERLAKDLLNDPKECAEHMMLLDLGRNDLGRVCDYGTVKVTQQMSIERYSHVMHMVSTVEGKLSDGKNALDVLKAAFPAGTVSGAPKIRAMEIIDELEPVSRGPYAGAVGYISFSGDLDTCITIRTLVLKNGTAYVQAGGGIVADSVPENEYQESLNKMEAVRRAIRMAENNLQPEASSR